MPETDAREAFDHYADLVETMHHDFESAGRDPTRAIELAERALDAARRWKAAVDCASP